MTTELPPISIVVIGRNEGQRLVRCLESVRSAHYPVDKLELIYVDTDSVDDSCEIARKLADHVIAIHPERPCAALARNVGLRAASHELVQFLDGDTILNRAWLTKAVAAIDDPTIACVFGRVEEANPTATIYNFWAHHDWYVPPGRAEACGGIAMFRRELLLKIGGYDGSLIAGEERDLSFRLQRDLGVSLLCLDAPMVLHDIHMTRFTQYWRRCIRTGHAYAETSHHHPHMGRSRSLRWRALAHATAIPAAGDLSLGLWSVWPLAACGGLLTVAIVRNAWRLRNRLDTLQSALLYSSHHYLCKTPIALGLCMFWLRSLLGRQPQPLIEYHA